MESASRSKNFRAQVRIRAVTIACGPSTAPRSHAAIVLRDSPVMREVSRPNLLRRLCKFQILSIMSMVIAPRPLLHKKAAGLVEHLAQFWVARSLKWCQFSVGADRSFTLKRRRTPYLPGVERCLDGAGEKSRTPDLRITNALLYQLSYTGALNGANYRGYA
jgi:hypothetical protein